MRVSHPCYSGHQDIEDYNPDQKDYEQLPDDNEFETPIEKRPPGSTFATTDTNGYTVASEEKSSGPTLSQPQSRELLDLVTDRKVEELQDHIKSNIKYESEMRTTLDKGRTFLHYAVYRGKPEIVDLLLEKGCLPDATDKLGRTPLHYAVANNKIKVIPCLVREGASVNCLDSEGRSPLHYAALGGYREIAFKLVCMGADPNIQDIYEMTPLDYASNDLTESILSQNGGANSDKGRLYFEGKKLANSLYDRRRELLCRGERARRGNKKFENVDLTDNDGTGADISHKDFIIHDILGKGSFGEVYLVEKRGQKNKLYAMKVFSKRTVQAQNLMRFIYIEKKIMHALDHPFMVRLHYAFQTDRKLYLLMDYCKNRDLGYLLKKRGVLTEQQARIVIAELVLAIEALHSKDIVHRDLKPDNILIDDDGHIKVTDFGLAKEGIRKGVLTKTFCGSIAYLPPEIIKKVGHNKMVDWYLVGVILYELVVGKPPYFSKTFQQLSKNILEAKLAFPKNSLSLNTMKFIKRLMNRDPGQRLGAKYGAEEIKKHDFFIGIDWEQIYNREIPPFDPAEIVSYKTNNYRQSIVDEAPHGYETIEMPNWSFVADPDAAAGDTEPKDKQKDVPKRTERSPA